MSSQDQDDEKQQLIGKESPPPYTPGTASVNKEDSPTSISDEPPTNPCLRYLYEHRASIPGYGMLKLVRSSSIYSLYVLLVLLMAYLLNQLDRYTLPIVTSHAGYDLNYGDVVCMTNTRVSNATFELYNVTADITKICSSESYKDEFNITYNVK